MTELKIELDNLKKQVEALQKYIELNEKNNRIKNEVFDLLTSNSFLIDALNAYGEITHDKKGIVKLTEVIQRQLSIFTYIERSNLDMPTKIKISKALEHERKLAFYSAYEDWAKAEGMEAEE